MSFIVTVTGWRDWLKAGLPPHVVTYYLERYRQLYGSGMHVRVGEATGVDKIVRDWLFESERQGWGGTFCVYHAEWGLKGRAAGPLRNGRMLKGEEIRMPDLFAGELAHELLGFPEPGIDWRQPGSGSVDCILQAVGLGITLNVPGVLKPQVSG